MNNKILNVKSPKNIDTQLKKIIEFLGLNEDEVCLLEYKKELSFDAEIDFCHLNVLIKCLIAQEGKPIFGWMLGQDKFQEFSEAQFHCVWKSPEGNFIDITPRKDREKRIMFIPDHLRRVGFFSHNGSPAIKTFNNVSLLGEDIKSDIQEIVMYLETNMIKKYGLAKYLKTRNSQ